MRTTPSVVLQAAMIGLVVTSLTASAGVTIRTERVSLAFDGSEADGQSREPWANGNGRYVIFPSQATNLVEADTNAQRDVFIRDRKKETTIRVSLAHDGSEAIGDSTDAAISASGRVVAFRSTAANLVPDDTNGEGDVFVRELKKGETTRISVASDGTQTPPGAGAASWGVTISANGRYVGFHSSADNLVPGDTNGVADVFVHDRKTGTTTRVSVATGGVESDGYSIDPTISGTGRYVAFESAAGNLVPNDDNDGTDIFVHDRKKGTTERVSVVSGGAEADGRSEDCSISESGRYVAFESRATNLVPNDTNGHADIFVHDRKKGTTVRVSVTSDGGQGDLYSEEPEISASGRYVTYQSAATDLVPGDVNGVRDIFRYDMKKRTTLRLTSGPSTGSGCLFPAISGNGRVVVFMSDMPGLVPDDTNVEYDAFAWVEKKKKKKRR